MDDNKCICKKFGDRNYSFVEDHNNGIKISLGEWTLFFVLLVTELAKE